MASKKKTSSKTKLLADACESLAADLEAGNGPFLGSGACFSYIDGVAAPHCAIGHVLSRAGFEPERPYVANMAALMTYLGLDAKPLAAKQMDAIDKVATVNDGTALSWRNQALIEPLRKLAAVLRQSAAAGRSHHSK